MADPKQFFGGGGSIDLMHGAFWEPEKREDNVVRPPHTQKIAVEYKRASEESPKVFQFWTPVEPYAGVHGVGLRSLDDLMEGDVDRHSVAKTWRWSPKVAGRDWNRLSDDVVSEREENSPPTWRKYVTGSSPDKLPRIVCRLPLRCASLNSLGPYSYQSDD